MHVLVVWSHHANNGAEYISRGKSRGVHLMGYICESFADSLCLGSLCLTEMYALTVRGWTGSGPSRGHCINLPTGTNPCALLRNIRALAQAMMHHLVRLYTESVRRLQRRRQRLRSYSRESGSATVLASPQSATTLFTRSTGLSQGTVARWAVHMLKAGAVSYPQ